MAASGLCVGIQNGSVVVIFYSPYTFYINAISQFKYIHVHIQNLLVLITKFIRILFG